MKHEPKKKLVFIILLVSDKLDFKIGNFIRDKEGHFIINYKDVYY